MATYTGYKKITKIRKYINGVPTDEIKENLFGQEGYIPVERSTKLCPSGCDDTLDTSGNVVNKSVLQTTTTTAATTNTTTASTSTYTQYDIINNGSKDLYIYYVGTSGPDYNYKVDANTSISVDSLVDPERTNGSINFTITKTNNTTTVTNTTTAAPIVIDSFTLSARNASSNLIFEHTAQGSNFETELEIVAGGETRVYSETVPRIASRSTQNSCAFEGVMFDNDYPVVKYDFGFDGNICSYTITNSDENLYAEIEVRVENGSPKVLFVGPDLTKVIKSTSIPIVKNSADNTNISVSYASNCTAIVDPGTAPRICEKYRVENISDETVSFSYIDCNGVSQEQTLDQRDSIVVGSRETPSLNVKTQVDELNEEADVEVTTTTSAPEGLFIKGTTYGLEDNFDSTVDGNCSADILCTSEIEKSLWYPLVKEIDLGDGSGNMDFVFTDLPVSGTSFLSSPSIKATRYVLEYDGVEIYDSKYIVPLRGQAIEANLLNVHLQYLHTVLTDSERLDLGITQIPGTASDIQDQINEWTTDLAEIPSKRDPLKFNFAKKSGVNKIKVYVYNPIYAKNVSDYTINGRTYNMKNRYIVGYGFRFDWNEKQP